MSASAAGASLRRMMILTCFSPGRPVRTSQEIGDLMGLRAVTVEFLMARLVMFGLIGEDATGVYHFPGGGHHLEVSDQR
jgi:hypothetical protein